ncbi:hypothetical protein IMCC3317_26070 [Kordia antarctica]|uniref:Uncharacterized protein n=1 Tax=Kordia antarctica TaxID=1218801 RepID=A0A7L4ZLC4_9FLAO|nr:contractile injection system tape measure protein [Kordia antarctica]QHI37229.1 hypothetical protein IMCC3317_26070 [Kordia antarctica]
MYNQEAHIVTRCQWNTGFDSKHLAHELQTAISTWSAYKMKRIITNVFDSICPKGQVLKINKLVIDLGSITYENMLSELPLRLEEALRNALYDLIMYPKSGDKTLEIVNQKMAQISVLRTFLLQGMMPWNYQETYGSAAQIMRSQLLNNRLDAIQMIQEIGLQENVRKRISWQFTDDTIKKIIAGLEPNNHQQIISFSEEFVKVQERETIVQTSTSDLKKNIWLWILNYLFTDRGTIFNKVAFVRNTVEQMANHFNLSYEAMLELIENAVERTCEYSHINKGFIAILRLLSEELHHTAFTKVKTKKQKENFWVKIADYFNESSKRSTPTQKNEFNELVINLSKLDATRFQKIVLNVEQKPATWKTILNDLIPASIENLFVALSPSQSKSVLTQISFLSKLNTETAVKIDKLDLYTFGIEFCIANQNASVSKDAFLAFIVQKLATKQQQTKLVILDRFVASNVTNTHKKTTFISLFKSLHTLYQQEVSSSKMVASEETLHRIITTYSSEIQNNKGHSKQAQELEKTILMWISTSPVQFWNVVTKVQKTHSVTVHILTLISTYGTQRFLKQVHPETFKIVEKVHQFMDELISKNPRKATALRAIKHVLVDTAFEVIWKHEKLSSAKLFSELLYVLKQSSAVSKVSTNAIEEAIQLLLKYPKTKTLAWSSQEFEAIKKQHTTNVSKTVLEEILEFVAQPNQEVIVATFVSKLVRAKKITTNEFKAQENTFISYLLSNGIQIRERLVSRFLQQISATKTTFTATEIKTLLQDCFWQSLVTYDLYRGNERKFIVLFEETVFETFPVLKKEERKQKIEYREQNIEKRNEKIEVRVALKNEVLMTPYKIAVSVLFEALKENLKTTNASFEISKNTYSYKQLFVVGLETSPTEIRNIIKETIQTEKQLLLVRNAITFEEFIVLIASDLSSSQQAIFKAIHVVFALAKQLGNSQLIASLETIFWKQTIALIQTKNTAKKVLEILVKTTFEKLSEIATLDQITIVKHIQNSGLKVPEILKTVLLERHQIFELVSEEIHENTLSEAIKTCIEQQKIELLSEYLITQFAIPAWFQHKETRNYRSIVNELILHQPSIILKTIRSQQISEVQLTKFSQTIHFATLIKSLLKLYPTQQKQLTDIQKLYEHIALISMNGISTKVLQEILVKKVLTAWRNSNWSLIASTNIWNEFLWETCGKKGVKERDFFKAMNTIKTALPASLLIPYKNVLPVVKPTLQTQKTIEYKNTKKPSMNTKSIALPDEGVPIPNAGLVLLNSYFLMLFERLGITADKVFKTPENQLDAVHYLQYIVTGLTQTDESLLTLNKVLCGLSPDTPVRDSIEMTQDQKQLIDGLIQAAIGYWSAIGDTSINGFRGNWLVRDGILRETDERWELTVEKRAYDILMLKSPFSFSIIKLPWMRKPLHVTWAY